MTVRATPALSVIISGVLVAACHGQAPPSARSPQQASAQQRAGQGPTPPSDLASAADGNLASAAGSNASFALYLEAANRVQWFHVLPDDRLQRVASTTLNASPVDVAGHGSSIYLGFVGGDVAALSSTTGAQRARGRSRLAADPAIQDLQLEGMEDAGGRVFAYGSWSRRGSSVYSGFVETFDAVTLRSLAVRELDGVIQATAASPGQVLFLLGDGRLYDPEHDVIKPKPAPQAAVAVHMAGDSHDGLWFSTRDAEQYALVTPLGVTVSQPKNAGVTDIQPIPGDRAVVVLGDIGEVRLYDKRGVLLAQQRVTGLPYCAGLVGDRVLIGTANDDRVVALDARTLKVRSSTHVGRGVVRLLPLS